MDDLIRDLLEVVEDPDHRDYLERIAAAEAAGADPLVDVLELIHVIELLNDPDWNATVNELRHLARREGLYPVGDEGCPCGRALRRDPDFWRVGDDGEMVPICGKCAARENAFGWAGPKAAEGVSIAPPNPLDGMWRR